jgi:general L-amino acid transport system substrate-binding protein
MFLFGNIIGFQETCDNVKTAFELSNCCNNSDTTVTFASTLKTVQERGSLKCGVKTEQYGMGFKDPATGKRSGLDVEYCRGIAAALGFNPETDIEWVYSTGMNRFALLADKTMDVLIRTSTWTYERDIGLELDFAAINFYDGQSFLVRGDLVPPSQMTTLDFKTTPTPIKVCVAPSTTTFVNMNTHFTSNSIPHETILTADGTLRQKFINGTCSVMAGDSSAMAATKEMFSRMNYPWSSQLWITKNIISKEPLASVVRDDDTAWKQVVQWVWYVMVMAEEKGWTSHNAAQMTDIPNLGNYGMVANTLPVDWVKRIIQHVGNFGEAYSRSFCDGTYDGVSGSTSMTGCVLPRTGSQNALASEGGLQFAPPMSFFLNAPVL